MAKEQEKSVRLSKALREFGIGRDTAVDFLRSNGVEIEDDQNAKIAVRLISFFRRSTVQAWCPLSVNRRNRSVKKSLRR